MSNQKDKKDSQQDAPQEEAVFRYVTKKLEKITSALYLITNFFPEREPLRNSIRQRSLELLSNTFSIEERIVSDPTQFATSIISTIREIVSLLRVAKESGLISDMNYTVLEKEFAGLLDVLGVSRDARTLPELSDTFFAIENVPDQLSAGTAPKTDKKPSTATKNSNGNGSKRVSKTKSRRRDEIVALLGEKGEVSITDISDEIQGCSQKTIQRELGALIDEGRVVKEGERRWSRYHLSKREKEAL